MPKKPKPEKLIERLIEEALRGYIAAAKNRTFLLEMGYTGLDMGRWDEKAQSAIRFGAILARVCDNMSHELQTLYAIEERLRQVADKGLHIVIEHVESPWRPEQAQSADGDASPQNGRTHPPAQPDAGQSEA